jgi:hypothetical protein
MARIFTPDSVDPEFAGRAIEHAWKHHDPLLRERLPSDRFEIYAASNRSDGAYTLIDPTVNVDALLRRTWREVAELEGYDSFEEFCEEVFEEMKDPDELAPSDAVIELVGRTEWPEGSAWWRVIDYYKKVGPLARVPGNEITPNGYHFMSEVMAAADDPRPVEDRDDPFPLGWVIAHDGPMPGSDFLGIEVSGPVGLACLQHVLDRAGAGIHITTKRPTPGA